MVFVDLRPFPIPSLVRYKLIDSSTVRSLARSGSSTGYLLRYAVRYYRAKKKIEKEWERESAFVRVHWNGVGLMERKGKQKKREKERDR